MSAFMLTTDAFHRIAHGLAWTTRRARGESLCRSLRRMAFTDEYESSEAIARDWHQANRLAILGRYGSAGFDETPEGIEFPCGLGTSISPIALYKLLQCLAYQCAEDVPPEHAEFHARMRKEIDQVLAWVGADIIAATPEYDAATWG